jgi:F-type H+-transporting ATPase subunit c
MDPVAATKFGAGIAMVGVGGVGVGLGILFSSLISAVGRNPAAQPQLFGLAILGVALTEALGVFALLIAFLLLYT